MENNNASTIIVLCSHLCVGEGVKPFEPNEWTKLADRLLALQCQPSDLLLFSTQDFETKLRLNAEEITRINRLIDRSASLSFELEKYREMGIMLVTRADTHYPKKLKAVLGKSCPPLFYYAGDITLADLPCIGFVGSRSIDTTDHLFTCKAVARVNQNGYAVVSGGANGVDSAARAASLSNGSSSVDFISDSFIKKIRDKTLISAIQNRRALILSVPHPEAGFNTGFAMMRNKFIYAQSVGTVVVKADLNKGGTWNGALDSLKNNWCPLFCWDNPAYPGNAALISKGAIPIDENWDGHTTPHKTENTIVTEQLSLFGE